MAAGAAQQLRCALPQSVSVALLAAVFSRVETTHSASCAAHVAPRAPRAPRRRRPARAPAPATTPAPRPAQGPRARTARFAPACCTAARVKPVEARPGARAGRTRALSQRMRSDLAALRSAARCASAAAAACISRSTTHACVPRRGASQRSARAGARRQPALRRGVSRPRTLAPCMLALRARCAAPAAAAAPHGPAACARGGMLQRVSGS